MTKKEWTSYIYNHLQKIDETNKYHPIVIEKTIDTVYSQLFSEAYIRDPKGIWKYVRDYSETLIADVNFSSGYSLANIPVTLPRINSGLLKMSFLRKETTAFTQITENVSFSPGKMRLNAVMSMVVAGNTVSVTFIDTGVSGDYVVLSNDGASGITINYNYSGFSVSGEVIFIYNSGAAYKCELTGRDMYNRSVDSTYNTIGVVGRYLTSISGNKVFFNLTIDDNSIIYYSIVPKFSTLSATDEVILPLGAEEVMADRVLDTMRLIPPVDLINDNADSYGSAQ